jgi:hypothetical protein
VNLIRFKIVACPFDTSDITAEYFVMAVDEQDALQEFRRTRKDVLGGVKEITPV